MTVIAQRVRRFVPTGRRQETARVVCPVDNWSFAPKFTNGVCPLCGYKPEGVEFHAPFGGDKASGQGPREQGRAAREFYTSTATITITPPA